MRMVAVCATDHILSGSDHTGYVINRHPELQEHGRTGMPKDMRGYLRPQPR